MRVPHAPQCLAGVSPAIQKKRTTWLNNSLVAGKAIFIS